MTRVDPSRRPLTTYRLQFNRDFGFSDARDLVPSLGNEADYEGFCSTLQAHGLGHIVDFVPTSRGWSGSTCGKDPSAADPARLAD
jgi:maltooligosyltrehalose synthase